jgi:CHAT domain-containing protein
VSPTQADATELNAEPTLDQTATLDIHVTKEGQILWLVTRPTQDPVARVPAQLHLPARRKQMIALLVDLLQQSTDVERVATDLEKTLGRGGERFIYNDLLMVTGHELFDLLFANGSELRVEVIRQLGLLQEGSIRRLRVKLCFDDPWLASLPWEYTRTPPEEKDLDLNGLFLSQMAELLLSRRVDVTNRDLTSSTPIRVLLVCSSPPYEDGIEPVDAAPVIEKLEALQRTGLVTVESLVEGPKSPRPQPDWRPAVTRATFQTAIKRLKPQIVHFVGHGRCFNGAGQLVFSTEDGREDWVNDEEFKRLINAGKPPKLVFLQACESALPDPYVSFSGVARTLAAARVPAIIGMQYRVRSSTASAFACEFYDALLIRNLPISSAVQAGRQKIADGRGFGLPVLYLSTDTGLLVPQAPLGPTRMVAIDRHDGPATQDCPRCGISLDHGTKVCRRCRLRLVCPNPTCAAAYKDPIDDAFCSGCGDPLTQAPFAQDHVAAIPRPSEVDSAPKRGALSLLRGTPGVR